MSHSDSKPQVIGVTRLRRELAFKSCRNYFSRTNALLNASRQTKFGLQSFKWCLWCRLLLIIPSKGRGKSKLYFDTWMLGVLQQQKFAGKFANFLCFKEVFFPHCVLVWHRKCWYWSPYRSYSEGRLWEMKSQLLAAKQALFFPWSQCILHALACCYKLPHTTSDSFCWIGSHISSTNALQNAISFLLKERCIRLEWQ